MKNFPKEWLALLTIAILVIGISTFEWQKNKVKDTSEVILNEVKGSSDGGGTSKRLEKEENNVTVIIEYLPDKSSSQLSFRMALDTHSVELDAFDFAKDVALEKDGKSISPTLLKQEGSGHHRSAELNFPTTNTPFTIVVKNLSNIPRREFSFQKLWIF